MSSELFYRNFTLNVFQGVQPATLRPPTVQGHVNEAPYKTINLLKHYDNKLDRIERFSSMNFVDDNVM